MTIKQKIALRAIGAVARVFGYRLALHRDVIDVTSGASKWREFLAVGPCTATVEKMDQGERVDIWRPGSDHKSLADCQRRD